MLTSVVWVKYSWVRHKTHIKWKKNKNVLLMCSPKGGKIADIQSLAPMKLIPVVQVKQSEVYKCTCAIYSVLPFELYRYTVAYVVYLLIAGRRRWVYNAWLLDSSVWNKSSVASSMPTLVFLSCSTCICQQPAYGLKVSPRRCSLSSHRIRTA